MKHSIFFSVLALTLFCFLSDANAEQTPRRDYLTFYSGNFDIIQHDNTAAQFGLEYRAAPIAYDIIAPMAGVNVTTDGSVYGYAG